MKTEKWGLDDIKTGTKIQFCKERDIHKDAIVISYDKIKGKLKIKVTPENIYDDGVRDIREHHITKVLIKGEYFF